MHISPRDMFLKYVQIIQWCLSPPVHQIQQIKLQSPAIATYMCPTPNSIVMTTGKINEVGNLLTPPTPCVGPNQISDPLPH